MTGADVTLFPETHAPAVPTEWPTGTCDWGRCQREAIEWRWEAHLAIWLPVCNEHRR